MKNYKATFSYHGKYFHGVAEQTSEDLDRVPTVMGKVREVIEMVAQQNVNFAIAGRTDRGVHALHQVMSFNFPDTPEMDLDISRLKHVLNQRLNPEIVFSEIVEVEEDFHARFSAKSRTYNYLINNSKNIDMFSCDFSWHIPNKLDLDAMSKAAEYFVGEKDFSSVCREDPNSKHNIREVLAARFADPPSHLISLSSEGLICFEISANAFCWQMVRSIVGVLVQVGKGKISLEYVELMLQGTDRVLGSQIAPPHGLFLVNVSY